MQIILCTKDNVDCIKAQLRACLRLLEHYEWLINSFVLDFFLDNHWASLPSSWRLALGSISPKDLARWLDSHHQAGYDLRNPLPLSLLALKVTIKSVSLERKPIKDLECVKHFLSWKQSSGINKCQDVNGNDDTNDRWQFGSEELNPSGQSENKALHHVFKKHVKPKKQHEISRYSRLIKNVTSNLQVDKVLDVGSGVGHLSRYLAYGHDLRVACVDGMDDFTDSAKKFDLQLETAVGKINQRNGTTATYTPPVHVTSWLSPDMDLSKFQKTLKTRFCMEDDERLEYGIVGLHTCGDLAPILLKLFASSKDASMLQSVGCCYMKIEQHFPMSEFVSCQPWHALTYTSKELSCHAIEMYTDRLHSNEQDKLKVHCYRALIEKLLVARDPGLRHIGLNTVKNAHQISFAQYAQTATKKLAVPLTEEDLNDPALDASLGRWWEVVVFYSLRLSLAPVIETAILLDRSLFLYENGLDNLLFPIFDPILSPRNHVLMAIK